jgi:hypothetical protein
MTPSRLAMLTRRSKPTALVMHLIFGGTSGRDGESFQTTMVETNGAITLHLRSQKTTTSRFITYLCPLIFVASGSSADVVQSPLTTLISRR